MRLDPLLDRKTFSAEIFKRDGHKCVLCGAPAVDAHHILDRKLFADGGYYLSNAASVCNPCHLRVEATTVTVEEVRAACGITAPVLPEWLDPSKRYDKWGNEVLADGTRIPGPLFGDDGCRKALQGAGLLWSGIFCLAYEGQN